MIQVSRRSTNSVVNLRFKCFIPSSIPKPLEPLSYLEPFEKILRKCSRHSRNYWLRVTLEATRILNCLRRIETERRSRRSLVHPGGGWRICGGSIERSTRAKSSRFVQVCRSRSRVSSFEWLVIGRERYVIAGSTEDSRYSVVSDPRISTRE